MGTAWDDGILFMAATMKPAPIAEFKKLSERFGLLTIGTVAYTVKLQRSGLPILPNKVRDLLVNEMSKKGRGSANVY